MLTRIERIGGGAHGEVYKARWGGRVVAAKILHPTASLAEADALADASRLRARGTRAFVELLDVGVETGRWLLITEWVDGPDAHRALRERGPAGDDAVTGVLAQCAHALQLAWSTPVDGAPLRMLHRDLKPTNLLLESDGRVRIADLGLASRWLRPGCQAAGTPAYAAPERYLGEESPAGDLYALGAIGYTLRTGRPLGIAGPHPTAHARRLRAARADLIDAGTRPRLVERLVALLDWRPENRPDHAELTSHGPHRRAVRAWLRPSLRERFAMLWPSRGEEVRCTHP